MSLRVCERGCVWKMIVGVSLYPLTQRFCSVIPVISLRLLHKRSQEGPVRIPLKTFETQERWQRLFTLCFPQMVNCFCWQYDETPTIQMLCFCCFPLLLFLKLKDMNSNWTPGELCMAPKWEQGMIQLCVAAGFLQQEKPNSWVSQSLAL